MPKFSTGWLDGFKTRQSIKKFKQYGKAGAVDLEAIEKELQEVTEAVKPYDSNYIYKINESAIHWKATPDGTLATQLTSGEKHDNTQNHNQLSVQRHLLS